MGRCRGQMDQAIRKQHNKEEILSLPTRSSGVRDDHYAGQNGYEWQA
jgi:hypothetical protein